MEQGKTIVRLGGGVLPYLRRRRFVFGLLAAAGALLLSQVNVFFNCTPLAAALYAGVDMAGFCPWYPLAGALIGAFCYPEINWVAVMAGGLYLFLRLGIQAIHDRPRGREKQLVLLLSELIPYLLLRLDNGQTALFGFFALAITLLVSIVLRRGILALACITRKKRLNSEQVIALCLLLCCMLPALSFLTFGTFSAAITLAAFVCLHAAKLRGMQAVALAAALSGVAVLCGAADAMFIANLTLCTLIAALFKPFGRWGTAFGFGGCGLLAVGGIHAVGQTLGAANLFIAVVAFLALPQGWVLPIAAAVDAKSAMEREERSSFQKLRIQTAEALNQTADAVTQLASMFAPERTQSIRPDGGITGQHLLAAAQQVCSDCLHRAHCYRAPEQAVEAIENMRAVYEKGYQPKAAFPLYSGCSRTVQLSSALSQVHAQQQQSRIREQREWEGRSFYKRQLSAVGSVMRGMAETVKSTGYYETRAEANLHMRLDEAGMRPKEVCVHRDQNGRQVSLTLHKSTAKRQAAAEEIAAKGVKTRLRLLTAEEKDRHYLLRFEEAGQLTIQAGFASIPKKRGQPCGDSLGRRALKGGGELYVISDGMGSGAAARQESQTAVSLLMELFAVGFPRDSALECVNRLLVSRGGRDMYATVDALCLNVRTGQAVFIKYGAPPSFILRGDTVIRVEAEALPAGVLEEAKPAVLMQTLRRGDAVVLLSDGVTDALENGLEKELQQAMSIRIPCDEAARQLTAAAHAQAAAPDDRSAIVLRIG